MCLFCALSAGFSAEGVDQAPLDFTLGTRRWTDTGSSSGGTTTSFGGSGGVITWSLGGSGLTNATGQTFFSGSTVNLSSFLNFDFEATLRAAFDAWAAVANIEFIQVADDGGNIGSGTNATIRIVGGFIDGASNVLARAFFPSGSATGGDIVFDSGETTFWTQNSFFLTALHEIGHSLGLGHESNNTAIMSPTINLGLTGLQTDDINGIRTLYGTQDFGPNSYFMPAGLANLTLIDGAPDLTVNGNTLANVITGSAAGEAINGNGGNDTLRGGDGNDTLDGGAGADSLYGEAGDDTFLFSSPNNGADTIFDFGGGDRIALRASAFGLTAGSLAGAGVDFTYGSAAGSSGPELFYNAANNRLYWDADGTGAGLAVELALFNGGLASGLGTIGANFSAEATGDFDRNGVSDVLWRDAATGATGAWLINADGARTWSAMGTVANGWDAKVSGDFDGSGTSDVLWRNDATGATGAWLMRNGQPTGWLSLGTTNLAWDAEGVGDFDRNGIKDIFWVNDTTRRAGAWLMNANGQPGGWLDLGTVNPGWEFKGVGDFNGDGTDDVLFYNTVTRAAGAWNIRNGVPVGWFALGTIEAGWAIDSVLDLNGDGTDDLHLYNANTDSAKGFTVVNGVVTGTVSQPGFDGSWSLVGAGQFNGAGAEDLLWRNTVDGTIAINSLGLTANNFIIV